MLYLKDRDLHEALRILLHWRTFSCLSISHEHRALVTSFGSQFKIPGLNVLLSCFHHGHQELLHMVPVSFWNVSSCLIFLFFPLPPSRCLIYSMTRINHPSNDLSPWSDFIYKWYFKKTGSRQQPHLLLVTWHCTYAFLTDRENICVCVCTNPCICSHL